MTVTNSPFRWTRLFAWIPTPVRLPFGAWWLLRNDNLGNSLRLGQFEAAELAFAGRLLKPGMTVLDLGAHQGLYTLLASKRVGKEGRVVAFEPSPRERKALRLNLLLNRCRNVVVKELALGDEDAQADLYVVERRAAGCNSLRPPVVDARTSPISVRVARLDDVLLTLKIDSVDFIKLDVEGAELAVLNGAVRLLEHRPRPVILAEVQDVRTQPWGYRARDIINHLSSLEFKWFRLSGNGSLEDLDVTAGSYDGNFVAWPKELKAELPGAV